MIDFIEREPESFNTNLQIEEHSDCLADQFSGRTTAYAYKGTGSDLVSPTMILVDDYDSEEEVWAAVDNAHKTDLERVSVELVAYRDKLLEELEYVERQIKDN